MLSTLCGIHPEIVPLDFFRPNEIVLICVVDRSRATWTRRLSATKIASEQHVSGKSGHIKDIGKLKVVSSYGFLKIPAIFYFIFICSLFNFDHYSLSKITKKCIYTTKNSQIYMKNKQY